MDECYALLFESTFSLAQSEPAWAVECLATQPPEDVHVNALRHLAHQVKAAMIAHSEDAIGYSEFYSRSHATVIQVFDASDVVIEIHEPTGDFREPCPETAVSIVRQAVTDVTDVTPWRAAITCLNRPA